MKTSLLFLLFFTSNSTIAQKVDTVYFYHSKYSSHKTEIVHKYNYRFTVYKLGYFQLRENGKDSVYELIYEEVEKEEYERYLKQWKDFERCTPCWQKTYDMNGLLKREGMFNTDCPIGEFREYDNGKLLIVSNWRRTTSEEWKGIFINQCSIKHGVWTYFKNGIISKTETYLDDKLIETKNF